MQERTHRSTDYSAIAWLRFTDAVDERRMKLCRRNGHRWSPGRTTLVETAILQREEGESEIKIGT